MAPQRVRSAPRVERRSDRDRRGGLRQEGDRAQRLREMAAFVFAFCGGLAALYAFFVIIGTIDVGDAAVATVIAVILAIVWLAGFWGRLRPGAALAQGPDRERRGF
jgi:hypothetical protein